MERQISQNDKNNFEKDKVGKVTVAHLNLGSYRNQDCVVWAEEQTHKSVGENKETINIIIQGQPADF